MQINSKMLVEALKKYAAQQGIAYKQLGSQLGFSVNKAKNVFTGRTQLSGDDVLRILGNHQYALPRLKSYLPYWRLRRAIMDVDKSSDIIDAVNEDAMVFPHRIQASNMLSNIHKPLSELARDIMHDKKWWALRNGWICSAEVSGSMIAFTPIAPDFVAAASAMKKMGWIWRNGQSVHADWEKINGGETGQEAANNCEKQLRAFILDPQNGFELDGYFRQSVSDSTIWEIEVDYVEQLKRLIDEIENIAEHWPQYELSETPDEYGVSVKSIYQSKFDYLEANVLGMCGIHSELRERKIEIDQETEQRYRRIMSEDGSHYRYSALIDPILAVNDRRGHLASPMPDDWKRYNQLQSNGL
ncbi:hypothetical protein [uncultured Bifidobacterium sp.]|uniref:hypothetical protein n=1 Tax=uncultured Bifidobacterium sp. TaxID=165187 RepID=UPI0025EC9396|nr:hypothetical protein [uncultured Bifidobacterium sp.]